MNKVKAVLMVVSLLLVLAITGCDDGTSLEVEEIMDPFEIENENVKFELSKDLKKHMKSEGWESLALITTICRS